MTDTNATQEIDWSKDGTLDRTNTCAHCSQDVRRNPWELCSNGGHHVTIEEFDESHRPITPSEVAEPGWKNCPQCYRENSAATWKEFGGKCPNCLGLYDKESATGGDMEHTEAVRNVEDEVRLCPHGRRANRGCTDCGPEAPMSNAEADERKRNAAPEAAPELPMLVTSKSESLRAKEVWPEGLYGVVVQRMSACLYGRERQLLQALAENKAKDQEIERLKADAKEMYDENNRMARLIDQAMHGEDAAQQSSLCDLVGPARDLRLRAETAEAALRAERERSKEGWEEWWSDNRALVCADMTSSAIRKQIGDGCMEAWSARDAEVQRLMDLVRHQRAELLRDGLISMDEFAALVSDSENGQRVARLETYDELRAELSVLKAAPLPEPEGRKP